MRAKGILSLIIVALIASMPALAQSDWQEVAHDSQANVTFLYTPGSVQRSGNLSTAKWHDTNHPELIFTAQIDCSARTIQSVSVDTYNADGSFKETVDLSANDSPHDIGPPGTFGSNLLQSIC